MPKIVDNVEDRYLSRMTMIASIAQLKEQDQKQMLGCTFKEKLASNLELLRRDENEFVWLVQTLGGVGALLVLPVLLSGALMFLMRLG